MNIASRRPIIYTVDYLDGYQYESGKLLFFPTAEGYVKYTVGVQNPFDYVFNYTDHLGNIRLSYGINPATGLLKKMEENNYYPFGLKHGTYNIEEIIIAPRPVGGPIAGKMGKFMMQKEPPVIAGELDLPTQEPTIIPEFYSGYNFKFNNREWQDELGLNTTAMDFRQYDNALGRFNSIDALSERAYDISPYRFALNNPNMWMDPSGLFETRKEAREYRREHNIRGGISKQSDGTFAINDKKNGVSYSKGNDANFGNDAHANDGVIESALVYNTSKNSESNVVSSGKAINDYAGLALAPLDGMSGSFRLGTAAQSFSPRYYGNSWGGNQFATTFKFGNLGRNLGVAGLAVGTIFDTFGVVNYYDRKNGTNSPNSVHPGKAGLNFGMGAYGLLIGSIPSILYSGIDTFYPGGWVGASETATLTENQEQKMTGHPLLNNSSLKF